MRILFAGSPAIAIPSLNTLVDLQIKEKNIEVIGILTNPDSQKGRTNKKEPTEIGKASIILSEKLKEHKLPPIIQLKPEKLDKKVREEVSSLKPDLLISFAYGHIFGPKFLSLFPLGGINIHPSLLPKYRGATPIPSAILNKEKETGITIQTIALEMDAGDILLQESFPLNGKETTVSLSEFIAKRSGELLLLVIKDIIKNGIQGKTQVGEASFCSLIEKKDGLINWELKTEDIYAQIRAFTPWPLSFTTHKDQYLYILEAFPYKINPQEKPAGTILGIDKNAGILVQTGDGILAITKLQYQAKKPLDWQSFINGARDFTSNGFLKSCIL